MSTPSSSSSGRPTPSRRGSPPRRRWPCLVVVLVLLVLLILPVSYALTRIFTASSSALLGSGQTRSAPEVASDFMDALKGQRYSQAYLDLDGSLQALLAPSDFVKAAQHADQCYGAISDFTQVESSSQKAAWRFTYLVTRKKVAHPYRFVLQLEQQPGEGWAITGYGGGTSLLPPNAACSS